MQAAGVAAAARAETEARLAAPTLLPPTIIIIIILSSSSTPSLPLSLVPRHLLLIAGRSHQLLCVPRRLHPVPLAEP
jgi:hypothetical protein